MKYVCDYEWIIAAVYADGYETEEFGDSEEECANKIRELEENHGFLVWHSLRREFNSNGTIAAEVRSYMQGNTYYNSYTSNNGGGYNQPYIQLWLEKDHAFIIKDTSCGEFGSRISAMLKNSDGETIRYAQWGTMEPELSYSQFTAKDIPLLDCICRLTGYYVPTSEEMDG